MAQRLRSNSEAAADKHRGLAHQIAHNLRFQHDWEDLRLHENASHLLISGLPPTRLYVHPDEQIELLQKQKAEGKTGMPALQPEREWVLPSQLRERWSLKRLGAVFDSIDPEPSSQDGSPIELDVDAAGTADDRISMETIHNSNRVTKRLLLATLDDDSTIVYYIVHDGIVKPRQN